jgi:predicted nucleotidyltransferase
MVSLPVHIIDEEGTDHSRLTVGKVELKPGAPHTIPGEAVFTLVGCDSDEAVMEALGSSCRKSLSAIAPPERHEVCNLQLSLRASGKRARPALRLPKLGTIIPKMGMKATGRGRRSRAADSREPATASAGLADALFGSTRRRVLGLLFGQPRRSFFVTEIMALTAAGRGAVQRELERLAQSGLVTVTKVGNQKHYQANRESALFEELCGIIRKTVGLEEPLRAALAPLAERIRLALIYGSIAKGLDTAASDVDLLIVSDDLTLEELYRALSRAETLLARKINPTMYTTAEFRRRRKARNPFLKRVLEGPTNPLLGSFDAK